MPVTLDELDDLLDNALVLECDPEESGVCYDEHYERWGDYRRALDEAYEHGLALSERHLFHL